MVHLGSVPSSVDALSSVNLLKRDERCVARLRCIWAHAEALQVVAELWGCKCRMCHASTIRRAAGAFSPSISRIWSRFQSLLIEQSGAEFHRRLGRSEDPKTARRVENS